MTGIIFGLLLVTALSFALRNTLWIGFLGVFLLCNLYPAHSIVVAVVAVAVWLFIKYRHRGGR